MKPGFVGTYFVIAQMNELKFNLSCIRQLLLFFNFTVFKHRQIICASIWTNIDVSVFATYIIHVYKM